MEVVAEAPGKIIITGEHFVVYGGLAVVAAINLRARVEARRSNTLSIVSTNYNVGCTKGSDCHERLRPLMALLDDISRDYPGALGEYTIRSEIPSSVGLGSSASVSVALTAAALTLAGETPLDRNKVYEYAMASEREIHGRPSGIDPAITTWGGLMLYSPNRKPVRLNMSNRLEVVVCNTGVERSTREMIEKVRSFKERRPALFLSLLESSSKLSETLVRYLMESRFEKIAPIIRWHQEALRLLGVSTSEVDCAVERLNDTGLVAKLTGAGGGGCVIGFPGPHGVSPSVDRVGCCKEVFVVKLPAEGVRSWVRRG